MQHIETIADVNQNGYVTIALPAHIRPGKHHILLVIDEAPNEDDNQSDDHAPQLMQMAGRDIFLGAGGTVFSQIPCLNDHPAYVNFLARRIDRWSRRSETPVSVYSDLQTV